MRFSFYAACFAATATATYTMEDQDAFADYLWAQMESGDLTQEEGFALAEQFADDLDLEEELAQDDGEPIEYTEVDGESQPIMADLKWLGSKALNGVKAVGRGIDKAYDATKAGVKGAAKAVYNAPGNIARAGNNWLKKHNFKAQTTGTDDIAAKVAAMKANKAKVDAARAAQAKKSGIPQKKAQTAGNDDIAAKVAAMKANKAKVDAARAAQAKKANLPAKKAQVDSGMRR